MGKKLTTAQFITKAVEKYGLVYDYSLVDYNGTRTPVTIICPKHGEFQQTPQIHLMSKTGCQLCASEQPPHNKLTTAKFVEAAKIIHGDTYDYSKTNYVSAMSPVTIICPKHGEFQQRPNDHTNNRCGCWECSSQFPLTTEAFVNNITNRFPATNCDLSSIEYIDMSTPVSIVCPTHGPFEVEPKALYSRRPGLCSLCNYATISRVSAGETEIADYIKSLGECVITSDRQVLNPQELDILVPDHNLAIEYCGLYWHSEQAGKDRNYHKHKFAACASNGIQLLTIFEDEWLHRRNQVEAKLKSLLGKSDSRRLFARKCRIITLSRRVKKQFFDEHHIQRSGPGSITYGLVHDDCVVAAMTFISHGNGVYTLNRYATSCQVVGGFTKLIKHFQKNNEWQEVISFADCRWSVGRMYTQTGWKHVMTIPPDYYYSPDAKHRVHKFNYRRSALPQLIHNFDPTLTERENCDRAGLIRIWDCGKMKFTLTNTTKHST